MEIDSFDFYLKMAYYIGCEHCFTLRVDIIFCYQSKCPDDSFLNMQTYKLHKINLFTIKGNMQTSWKKLG